MRAKPRDIIPKLLRAGWVLRNIRGGSHAIFTKPGEGHITIPGYNNQNAIVNMNTQDRRLKEIFKTIGE